MSLFDRLYSLSETIFTDRRTGKETTGHLLDRFANAKGHFAKAYSLEEEIRQASKRGVIALKNQDAQAVEEVKTRMNTAWEELDKLDLPADVHWKHDAQAGQELVEFHVTCWIYPNVFGGDPNLYGQLQSALAMKVTPQCWLAGIGDAITEIGKMLIEHLCSDQLTHTERIEIRQRYISVAKEICQYLEMFEGCVPQIINNNRYRGYFNTFRGLISRIQRVIQSEQEALIRIYDTSQ